MKRTLIPLCTAALSLGAWAQTPVWTDDLESAFDWTATASGRNVYWQSGLNQVPAGGAKSLWITNSACRAYASSLSSGLAITDANDSVRFSYWLYDPNTNNSVRGYADVRNCPAGHFDPAAPSAYNQILAIGPYNQVTIPNDVTNMAKYFGRVVSGFPGGWFTLNNAPDRTAGWHQFAIERGLNSASQVILKFYQDGILGRAFTNTGANALSIWNAVTLGLGAGSTAGNQWHDGYEVVQGQAFLAEEPKNSTNILGNAAFFSAYAYGSASPVYYWWFKDGALLKDDAKISGSTTSFLTVNDCQVSDKGWYSVMVSNAWGVQTSAVPAYLDVGGVSITVQPTNQVVNLGSNDVSFYIEAMGVGNIFYQWKKDGVSIPGATGTGPSSTFTIPTVGASDLATNPGYTCLVTNDQRDVSTSAVATLRSNAPPGLSVVPNLFTNLGTSIAISVTATDDYSSSGFFQGFESASAGATVTFQYPRYSGTAANYVSAEPGQVSYAYVTNANLPAGNIRAGGKGLYVQMTFTNETTIGWDRLTTAGFNPIVWFLGPLTFDIWTDRPMGVSVGLSESNPTGTIGANGGTSSSIENAGVDLPGSIPHCIFTTTAGTWTNFTYDLADPTWAGNYIRGAGLVGGNGMLDSTTGKGVLENVGLVPADGLGTYKLYLDNFQSLGPNWISYSLDVAPADATIDTNTGVIRWSVPLTDCTTNFTVRATDHLGLFTTQSFTVTAPAAPAGEPLKYGLAGGQLVLSWTNASFSLASSVSVTGPYTKITGATSPYTNAPSLNSTFYRLVWP